MAMQTKVEHFVQRRSLKIEDAGFSENINSFLREAIDQWFYTNIVVVRHRNLDDVQACRKGQPLSMVREPGNESHDKAIRIETPDGKEIGYLERRWADEVTNSVLRDGRHWVALVQEVSLAKGRRTAGMVIVLARLSLQYVRDHPPEHG